MSLLSSSLYFSKEEDDENLETIVSQYFYNSLEEFVLPEEEDKSSLAPKIVTTTNQMSQKLRCSSEDIENESSIPEEKKIETNSHIQFIDPADKVKEVKQVEQEVKEVKQVEQEVKEVKQVEQEVKEVKEVKQVEQKVKEVEQNFKKKLLKKATIHLDENMIDELVDEINEDQELVTKRKLITVDQSEKQSTKRKKKTTKQSSTNSFPLEPDTKLNKSSSSITTTEKKNDKMVDENNQEEWLKTNEWMNIPKDFIEPMKHLEIAKKFQRVMNCCNTITSITTKEDEFMPYFKKCSKCNKHRCTVCNEKLTNAEDLWLHLKNFQCLVFEHYLNYTYRLFVDGCYPINIHTPHIIYDIAANDGTNENSKFPINIRELKKMKISLYENSSNDNIYINDIYSMDDTDYPKWFGFLTHKIVPQEMELLMKKNMNEDFLQIPGGNCWYSKQGKDYIMKILKPHKELYNYAKDSFFYKSSKNKTIPSSLKTKTTTASVTTATSNKITSTTTTFERGDEEDIDLTLDDYYYDCTYDITPRARKLYDSGLHTEFDLWFREDYEPNKEKIYCGVGPTAGWNSLTAEEKKKWQKKLHKLLDIPEPRLSRDGKVWIEFDTCPFDDVFRDPLKDHYRRHHPNPALENMNLNDLPTSSWTTKMLNLSLLRNTRDRSWKKDPKLLRIVSHEQESSHHIFSCEFLHEKTGLPILVEELNINIFRWNPEYESMFKDYVREHEDLHHIAPSFIK